MNTPQLSIVVPTCDRPTALAALLERLQPERLLVPPDSFEVIVSDDGLDLLSAEMVRSRFPRVRFCTGPRRGPAANRNHGARQATGEWLVFIDDDCQPAAMWLRAIADQIAVRPLDVVEGKIVAPDKQASLFRRDVENLGGDCYWSANIAVRREFFERINGFDEDFLQAGGEDLELAHRFRTRGARVAFCTGAVVDHPSHVMTWPALLEFTFRIKWHPLYLLKTGQTLPEDAPVWKVIPHVILSRTLQLARTTRRHLASARREPAALATAAYDLALFPLVLPYLLYWHLHFSKLLRERVGVPHNYGGSAAAGR